MTKPTLRDQTFAAYQALWDEKASKRGYTAISWSADMFDVLQWVEYCAQYKPVPYNEWLGLCERHQLGEIPAPKGSIGFRAAVELMPDGEAKEFLMGWVQKIEEMLARKAKVT